MKSLKCTYPKIKGGFNAIIELEGKVLEHRKFPELNDAINWTNSFCEGFRKYEEILDKKRQDIFLDIVECGNSSKSEELK